MKICWSKNFWRSKLQNFGTFAAFLMLPLIVKLQNLYQWKIQLFFYLYTMFEFLTSNIPYFPAQKLLKLRLQTAPYFTAEKYRYTSAI